MELKEASSKEGFLDLSELTLHRHYLKRRYYEYYLSVPHLKQVLMNNCSQQPLLREIYRFTRYNTKGEISEGHNRARTVLKC